MKGFARKATALIMSFTILAAYAIAPAQAAGDDELPPESDYGIAPYTAGIDEPYTCDFMSLVKENAQTAYGTEDDKNIQIDEYTTADLSYAGTYVTADGKVYIKSGTTCNGNGKYAQGSHLSFTAPSAGTINVTGADIGYFEGETYLGYNAKIEIDAKEGITYHFGWRKDTTYIDSLTFTPVTETPEPTDPPEEVKAYQPPKTTWDFNNAVPAVTKKADVPYISGTAVYDSENQEIKFPFTNTNPGYLTVDLTNPIKATPKENNVKISFSIMNHTTRSGTYVNYKVLNSEGETIVSFQAHPYSYDTTNYPITGIVIGGQTVESSVDDTKTLWDAISSANTDILITTEIDYYARKAKVTVGTAVFEGDIPESAVQDVKTFEFSATRKSTEGTRYLSLDDLTIEEYTSTAQAAPAPEIASGYTAETIGTISARVKTTSAADGLPVLIYLCGSSRFGTDNYSQLYNAQYLFNAVGDKAVLIAPQGETEWNIENLKAFIEAAKSKYSADKVIVAGQGEGADAAYALADTADKIIPIGGTAAVTVDAASAAAKVWAFADYTDANTAKIRTAVSALQKAAKDVTYTEFPFDESKGTAEKAAAATGLVDWITTDVTQPKMVDLVLFAGQSNMAGRGEYDEAIECAPGHGFEYHSVTEPGVLTTVSEPFGKYENNDTMNDNGGDGVDRRSGDMVSSFMESYYKTSGVPIVGVQASRGGQATDYFMGTAVMSEMISRYNEAEKYLTDSGYTIGKKFMVWCQGETDADRNRTDDSYKTNTLSIFNSLKTGTGLTDMFMIRIGHCKTSGAAAIDETNDPNYKRINLAQKALADATDGITAVASFYTDEYAALMRDQYHYHQPAYNSVGTIAGNNTAYTLYSKGTWTEYPEPDEIVATPMPVEGVYEITSSAASVDVSTLKMYDNTTYRMYKPDGSYETVKATNGVIANTTGDEVTIVPEYKFEFTNQTNPTDKNIAGYVKVAQGSYTEEKGYGLTSENYSINANGCKVDSNPIKVILADGFYDITVYRLGGSRADIYSKGKLIANNTTSATAQNRGGASALMEIPGVKLSDGSADITFGNLSGNNERIASLKIVRVPEKYRKPVIWIAGDSESSNYYPFDADGDDHESNKIMITGFGQQLSKVLSDKYSISNYGQPSATVKTWYDECFESVNDLMQAGDTILIDFGINDSISSSNKMTIDEMKAQMKLIIDAAKAKDVTPILISPVYNSKYQHRTYFTYDSAADTNAMYAFAEEMGIDCIDLNKWTQLYVNEAIEKTGDANWVKNNYHVDDELHLTQHSAVMAASFIAAAMEQLGYETANYSCNYADISNVGEGNVRGTETGVKRVYNVEEMRKFMGLEPPEPTATPEVTAIPQPTETPSGDKVALSYNAEDNALTLTTDDEELTEAVVIKAAYNDDNTISYVKIYFASFEDLTAEVEDITIAENEKIFVWNSTKGMKPLAKVSTLLSLTAN